MGRQVVAMKMGMVWKKEAGVEEAEARGRCRRQDSGGHGTGEVDSCWMLSGANLEQWIWRNRVRHEATGLPAT
jgi:hypothetical protein